jgi:tetratricopeptide (TPR) repeat protein
VSAGLDPSAPASRNPSVAPGDGAGEAPSGTSKDIVEARRLFQEGKAFFDRGDYPQALDRFVAAQHFAPQPAMLYDIGRTLELMGRNGEAADVYEHYLQTDLSHMDRMSMELRIKQLRSAGP